MARGSDYQRIALLLGTAGVAVAAATILRRRFVRPPAVTQALTILVSKERAWEFFRDPDRVSATLAASGIRIHDLGIDARDDVVTWNGGGVYLHDAPGGRGTEVYLSLHSAHKTRVKEAIRRAKSLLETGELPTGRYTR